MEKRMDMKFGIRGCAGTLLLGCLLAACDDTGGKGEGADLLKEATYLFYMVGQNNLKDFLNENIDDLKTGYGETGIDANILVYADIDSTPILYMIGKDDKGTVHQTVVKTYPDQYSVNPEIMKGVINEVFAQYPAKRRGITFSSHADGSLYTSDTVKTLSFGYEGSKGYGMNITNIREALGECPHLDMIMFDACMMANVETAYELKDCAHYLLSAPNSIPAEGFPYDETLPYLLRMDADGLGAAARAYMEYFRNNGVDWDDFVAISVSDLSRMDDLASCMDAMFQDGTALVRMAEIDRDSLQSFETGYQLYDFGEWVDSIGGSSSQHVRSIRSALEEVVVYKDHDEFSSVNEHTEDLQIPIKDGAFSGLNTYVPPKTLQRLFRNDASERAMMHFFTSLKWYRDAGFWRVPFYKVFEQDDGNAGNRRRTQ